MKNQVQLAAEMLTFLKELPASAGLETVLDPVFLREFEAARLILVHKCLEDHIPNGPFNAISFGYLHGLPEEFLHRFFPGARFTTCDRAESPIFSDPAYLSLISKRQYVRLKPLNISDVNRLTETYQVIFLGEIIEHINPTMVFDALRDLSGLAAPNSILVITTPNGSGLYNYYMTLRGKNNAVVPPIPDPVMGYGHIHLWSPSVLEKTARACGWKMNALHFYHGREGEMFCRAKHEKIGLRGRIFLNALRLATWKFPQLKGFLVASFVAD